MIILVIMLCIGLFILWSYFMYNLGYELGYNQAAFLVKMTLTKEQKEIVKTNINLDPFLKDKIIR
jgi:hypothetical protein